MLKIGITGGMGSGKSAVCRLLALYGAPAYIADLRAATLVNRDEGLRRAITALLGEEAYVEGLVMDRRWVARRIFADAELLRAFDALVHPAVARDFAAWAAGLPGDTPYILLESAILFESGFDAAMDVAVAVSAPAELRIERVLKRDPGATREAVMARMAHQMSDAERAQRADYQIVNDGHTSLVEQVARLHGKFLA